MSTPTNTSELDKFFPRDENGKPTDPTGTSPTLESDFAEFEMAISATFDELMPGANKGQRKAILQRACGTAELKALFDKQPAEYWCKKIASTILAIEQANGKKPSAQPEPETQPANDTAPVSENEVKDEPKSTSTVNLDNLAEAPFSSTFRVFHKVYNVEVQFTIRSSQVADGMRKLNTVLDWALNEEGPYTNNRTPNPAPSTSDRRVGTSNAPPAAGNAPVAPNKPPAAPSPVKSFDPDEGQQGGVQHAEISQIEKVMAQDGKVQINLYPVLATGKQADFPMFYMKNDADKELVFAVVDVEAMQLATRYDFPCMVDYELSKKMNSKGNPYKNVRAIHPKAK